MAKFIKLPEELKFWKINSVISESKDGGVFKVSRKDYDGSTIKAILLNISVKDDDYNSEHIDFIKGEAGFLQTVSRCGNHFNYIDIFVSNKPTKEKIDLYIITEELPSLAEVLRTKKFSEEEIVDFGIQISSALESLEAKSIFHGNLTPENIYIDNEGTYKIGGFSDFESRISDFSFVAPEIYKKEDADFTTDIYSLGLIMYYMCNENKLPFEDENTDKNAAVEKRLAGADVSTPASGSDKLKSVIMIACKADNKYRWKNAGNIKNALLSMKGDAVPVHTAVSAIPESTDFEGNVFDEFEYEEFEEPKQEEAPTEEQTGALTAEDNTENTADAQNAEDNSDEIENKTSETPSADDEMFEVVESNQSEEPSVITDDNKTVSYEPVKAEEKAEEKPVINAVSKPEVVADEAISDEQIFDNIEAKGKNKLESSFEKKDYGSFFDDDYDIKPVVKNTGKPIKEFDDDYDDEDDKSDDYDDNFDITDDDKKVKNNKKKVIVVTLIIIAALALLGVVGYFALSGSFGGNNNKETTQPTTQIATEASNTAATAASTAQPTTVAPTTVQSDSQVVPVVGYGYSYGKKLLEQAGFTVEIGEYKYSEEYPEGYIIAQSPEGDVTAKAGTVVTLDISLGLVEPETEPIQTEAPTEAPTQAPTEAPAKKTNNSFVFPTSSTAYISKSDVEKLSADELNIAINEIYARNGRIFTTPSLADYFNSQSWYTPKYTAEEFDKNVKFNQYEQTNLQLLISYR